MADKMQKYFEEIDDYMRTNGTSKSFFKELLESVYLPIKESLEDITKDEVIESMFGGLSKDLNTKKLQKALDKVKPDHFKNSQIIVKGGMGIPSDKKTGKKTGKKKESGLSQTAIPVHISGIDKEVLNKLGSSGKSGKLKGVVGKGAGLAGKGLALGAGAAAGIGLVGGIASVLLDPGGADQIVENVKKLLKMANETTGGADFFATMVGIGTGLAVFSVGYAISGIAGGVVSGIEMLTGENTIDKMDTNVRKLLKLANETSGGDAADFFGTMAAIGSGLAIYGIGSAIVGVANGVSSGIDALAGDSIDKLIQNTHKLLKLANETNAGDAADFTVTMTAIATGLIVFGVGSTVSSAANGISSGIDALAGMNSIDTLVSNTNKLLKLARDTTGGESLDFIATMVAIATGIAVFGGAQLVGGLLGMLTEGITTLSGVDTIDNIVEGTNKLMGINADVTKAEAFSVAMGHLGAGLLKFSGANFGSTLLDTLSGIFGWFSSKETGISAAISAANKHETIYAAGNSLTHLAKGLKEFGDVMKGVNIEQDFESMGQNLGKFVNALDVLIEGGDIDVDWGWDLKVSKGLKKIDTAAFKEKMSEIRAGFGDVRTDIEETSNLIKDTDTFDPLEDFDTKVNSLMRIKEKYTNQTGAEIEALMKGESELYLESKKQHEELVELITINTEAIKASGLVNVEASITGGKIAASGSEGGGGTTTSTPSSRLASEIKADIRNSK